MEAFLIVSGWALWIVVIFLIGFVAGVSSS